MKTLLAILFLTLPYFQRPDENNGILYFSLDNGNSWQNKSDGLPENVSLTDFAITENGINISTKQHGIFLYDFQNSRWAPLTAQPITTDNIDAIHFYHNKLFAGTQHSGVFVSADKGKTWSSMSSGLKNLTIRKLKAFYNKFYAATNEGLYSFNEVSQIWTLEFNKKNLQVNGITSLDDEIYIGTTQGVFKSKKNQSEWKQVLANRSLHNIGTDGKNIYALTYGELFKSGDKGIIWTSDQKGMPDGMYTFHVVPKDKILLAAQWDGVYKKMQSGWVLSSKGLPHSFPVTELAVYQNIIIASGSDWEKK